MRGPPDNGGGRASHSERPGPTPTTTTTMLLDQGDPRRIGELLSDWMAIRMAEVDDLVDEARAKTAAIPDQRQLWLLVGELVVRVHCLELAADQQRKAARR